MNDRYGAPSSGASEREDLLAALLLDDDDIEQPPLTSYPLQTREGREAFLEAFAYVGEPAIFEAISHIWASLAEPKNARCIQMGLQAGTGGSGKAALRKFLLKFLEEYLGGPIAPLPKGTDFDDMDEWNKAVQEVWAGLRQSEEQAAARYARILDGRPG